MKKNKKKTKKKNKEKHRKQKKNKEKKKGKNTKTQKKKDVLKRDTIIISIVLLRNTIITTMLLLLFEKTKTKKNKQRKTKRNKEKQMKSKNNIENKENKWKHKKNRSRCWPRASLAFLNKAKYINREHRTDQKRKHHGKPAKKKAQSDHTQPRGRINFKGRFCLWVRSCSCLYWLLSWYPVTAARGHGEESL